MTQPSLLHYIETGQLVFREGSIVFFGYNMIFTPTRTMALIRHLLLENYGDKATDVLYKGGYGHLKHIFGTFSSKFDLSKMDQKTFLDLFTPSGQTLGLGEFKVISLNPKTGLTVLTSNNNPFAQTYKEMYGKQEKGVDDFIRGMIAYLSEAFSKKQATCEETKCIAKGDKYCEFITKPKK